MAVVSLVVVACGGGNGGGGEPAGGATPRVQERGATVVPVEAGPSGGAAPTEPATRPAELDIPADFGITLYQGQAELGLGPEFRFSDLFTEGRPVILNFWAGLCPPCRAELPDLQTLNNEFAGRVRLFSLDVGPFTGLGSRDDGRELLQELGITYPAGTTFDQGTVRAYRILGMPTTFFMTPTGKVTKKWTGLLTLDKMRELTRDVLAESRS